MQQVNESNGRDPGRKRKLPWLDGKTSKQVPSTGEHSSTTHNNQRVKDTARKVQDETAQGTSQVRVTKWSEEEKARSNRFFARFVDPAKANLRSSSVSSLDNAVHRAKGKGRDRSANAQDVLTSDEVPPVDFLSQLIVNIERSRQLELTEAKLSALASDESAEVVKGLKEQILIESAEQAVRTTTLYELVDYEDLDKDFLSRRFDARVLRSLAHNKARQEEMDGEQDQLEELADRRKSKRKEWDAFIRARATFRQQDPSNGNENLRRTEAAIVKIGSELKGLEVEFVNEWLRVENNLVIQRQRIQEFYRLAEKALVHQGLLDPRPPELSPPRPEQPEPRPPEQIDAVRTSTSSRGHTSSRQQTPVEVVAQAQQAQGQPEARQEPPKSVTAMLRDDIENEMKSAYKNLEERVHQLETVRNYQKEAAQTLRADIKSGKITCTQLEFDLWQYFNRKERNHRVIEAEARLQQSKETAKEFGVLPAIQSSGFRDNYPEDVPEDAESDVLQRLAAFDRRPIEDWRRRTNAAFPRELADPHQPVAMDEAPLVEFFETKSPIVGDSRSNIAYGKTKHKILRYGAGP